MLKKQYFVILLGIALFIGTSVWAEWVPLTRDAATGSLPQIKILASDDSHAVVEVTLPGFYRDADANTNLWKIHIPGAVSTEELGKSALSVISGMLALPADVVQVHIAHQETLLSQEFRGLSAYPVQKPTTDEEKEGAFLKDDAHYRSNDFYPLNRLTLGNIAIWRNQKVISFRLSPMQIKPASGILLVHSKVSFTLQYERGRNDVKSVPHSAAFEDMYQRLLLNYTPVNIVRRAEKYLVITQDDLASAIQPLVDWRASQGYDVKIVKLSEVGSGFQKIKDFVVQEYAAGLAYVLLVGDPASLPYYLWDSNPSDYWYACVAGTDLLADIAVGRICATTATEVNSYIAKIKAYESYQTNGEDWAVKSLLIAHKEGAPGKYQGCMEEARTATYQYKVVFNTRYGSQGCTNADIRQDFEEGRAIVAYRGHGSETAWYGWNGTNFATTDMRSMNNTIYPVVFSIACSNASLDQSAETFSESCVKNPNGGGSAFLGASRPSYTVPNHDFCKALFKGAYNEGYAHIGNISNYANAVLVKQYGETSYAMANVKMYLWLGDPAQKINLVK